MATYEISADLIKRAFGRLARTTDAAVRGAVDAVRKLEGEVTAGQAAGDALAMGMGQAPGEASAQVADAQVPSAPVSAVPDPEPTTREAPGATATSVESTANPKPGASPVTRPLAEYAHPGYCTFERDRLSASARRAYQAIRDGVLSYRPRIQLFGVTEAEIDDAYEAMRRSTPEVFWLDGYGLQCVSQMGRIWELEPSYRIDRDEAARLLAEMEERSRPLIDALAQLPAPGQRVQAAHNALILNAVYSDTGDPFEYTAVGALVRGKAACSGLAYAFKYLMDRLEVPCLVVRGTAASAPSWDDPERHSWNLVELDGRWTHVDVTYDLGFSPAKRYPHLAYLGVSDEEIAPTHRWERDALPAATFSLGCYRRRGRCVSGWDELAGLFDLTLARDHRCAFQLDERLTRSGIEPFTPLEPEVIAQKIYDVAGASIRGSITEPVTLALIRDDVMHVYEVTVE